MSRSRWNPSDQLRTKILRRDQRRRLGAAAVVLSLLASAVVVPVSGVRADTESFHTMCRFVKALPDDPIFFPNQPGASHLHDFFGNTTTNASSTLTSLLRGGTSCNPLTDTAAYWVPALVSPSGKIVTPDRISAYYWRGDVGRSSVTPFPSGLRMIAGGDTRNLRISGYACGEGQPVSSVPVNCGSGQLRGVIVFPSCWDGRRLDSPDHRSHMAYPGGRGCPRGYPVRVPKLVVHVRYPISNGQGYGLVSDATFQTRNGRSLHSDFINSWNQTAFVQLVQSCLNGQGTCPT